MWKQQGNIHLWEHPEANRSYRGWHLAMNTLGHRSLLYLLDRPVEVIQRTVQITEPSASTVAISGCKKAYVTPTKLRVLFTTNSTEFGLTPHASGEARLSVGDVARAALADWLRDPSSAFDTSFGEGDSSVSFWGLVN